MPTLWITPKWPLPVDDGARVATRALVRHLEGLDLLALAGREEPCDETALRGALGFRGRVHVLRRESFGRTEVDRQIRNLLRLVAQPGLPVTVARYGTGALQRAFQQLLAAEGYRVLVFDGLHGAALLARQGRFRRPPGIRVVYRAHNVETVIWRRAAARAGNPLERQLLERQQRLMARFEASVLEAADLVAPVSAVDLEAFRKLAPAGSYVHAPIGLDFSQADSTPPPTSLRLLFLGRLDWPPNRDGLRWFLTEVWPRVERADVTLAIAGSGDGAWLAAHRRLPRVEILGRVADAAPLYRACAAVIVPVFHGGGVRLKAIEPAAFQRAVVSTTLGVEGSGLEEGDYLRADTAEEWAAALARLDLAGLARLGAQACRRLRPLLTEEAAASTFRRALANAIPSAV